MQTLDAILQRKSVRAFLNKPIEGAIINDVLDIAKYAPSSTNMQPWEVAVVSGKTKELITKTLTDAFINGHEKTPDYSSYPKDWFEPFSSRRKALGLELYQTLGIARDDKEAQKNNWIQNYSGFNAPTILFIFTDQRLSYGSYIDCGSFMQNLMLAFLDKGLATCPQASFIDYAGLIKTILGGHYQEKTLIAGIAVGYEDVDKPVNKFRSQREPLDNFVTYFS